MINLQTKGFIMPKKSYNRIPFQTIMSKEVHSELKKGCEKLNISITSVLISGGLRELRAKLKHQKLLERALEPDYSNR